MKIGAAKELPPGLVADYQRSRSLAWWSIGFMISSILVMYLTLGSSQAMKAAWIEDLVSLLPPAAFLLAARYHDKPPSPEYPYGLHRSVSIGYLMSSIVLFAMGAYIIWDSGTKLLRQEHPTIGGITIFGTTIWFGWLMIAALTYTIVPSVILGRKMLPIADNLHDKALFAEAKMLKADWGTAAAGIAGILGIGLGLWWADAVAALAIGLDVAHDGWTNTRRAMQDLADGQPRLVDGSAVHPLRARLETELSALDWVDEALVRVRDEGHVFFAEALVVPGVDTVDPGSIEEAVDLAKGLDWRLHEIVISPVERIDAIHRTDT